MIEDILPVSLASFTSLRREAQRPVANRNVNFTAEFDDETLFFDAFWAEKGTEIVLVGPPLFNLEPFFSKARIFAQPSGKDCTFKIRKLDRLMQVRVDAPPGTIGLKVESELGAVDVPVSASGQDIFAERRVLFTISKNNKLEWIQDWIRYHRDVHGADAVLIYDNGSTDYDLAALGEAIGALKGIKAARIVPWPFKFGPQGTQRRGTWDSDFCQLGALEHARRRYLGAAASVMNCDIDELVVGPNKQGVFAAAENSRSGILRYYGRWVYGVSGLNLTVPPQEQARHRDFFVALRPKIQAKWIFFQADVLKCPPKWTVVPARCPDGAQWKIHVISGWLAARLPASGVSFRHFRSISNSWKYLRGEVLSFDRDVHEVDETLRANYALVDWQA